MMYLVQQTCVDPCGNVWPTSGPVLVEVSDSDDVFLEFRQNGFTGYEVRPVVPVSVAEAKKWFKSRRSE